MQLSREREHSRHDAVTEEERDTMHIRPARAQDAESLGHVMVESWLAAHREQIPEEAWQKRRAQWTPQVSARAWGRTITDLVCAETPDGTLLVADSDDSIVGLVHGRLTADGEVATGEVLSLYVATSHQRRGVGQALLRAAARELQQLGAEALHLSVLTANRPARAFYEAMGGREIGVGDTDEEGHRLPTTVYGWVDLWSLGPR